MKTHYNEIEPYRTKDGSLIRELMHPQRDGNKNQSLAEATVPAGCSTRLHLHHLTEEIYHIIAGQGWMMLDEVEFEVQVGDSICIPPEMAHRISNDGEHPLVILCCCSPAYSDENTKLLGDF